MAERTEDKVSTKLKELTISQQEIEKRKAYVGLGPSDLERIAAIKNIVVRNARDVANQFFDSLSRFPESKGIFVTPALLEEAKTLKKEHLEAMACGEYGQYYVDQRIRLGRIYSRAGLEPKIFLGAFHSMLKNLGSHIVKEFRGEAYEALESFFSLKKIAFLDLGLIVDVIVYDRERTIRQQQEAIRELSTPVFQLRNRLLILPIVGMIDTYRARLLTENLLRSIRDNRAKVVVIDITGVPAVDSKVANHLVQTVSASRLMGAKVIVTGLSSEVAQTLVTLGVELTKLNTVGDLQGGIEEAERLLGIKVTQEPEPVSALMRA